MFSIFAVPAEYKYNSIPSQVPFRWLFVNDEGTEIFIILITELIFPAASLTEYESEYVPTADISTEPEVDIDEDRFSSILSLAVAPCSEHVSPIVNLKESYTIDYLKSNKWCTTGDTSQRCCEFNDNQMKVTKNGQPEASLDVVFEQKTDSLIIVKITGETGFKNNFKMKSLDTLYLSLGDQVEMFKKLYRVK